MNKEKIFLEKLSTYDRLPVPEKDKKVYLFAMATSLAPSSHRLVRAGEAVWPTFESCPKDVSESWETLEVSENDLLISWMHLEKIGHGRVKTTAIVPVKVVA